jgi:hypothetical protein
MHSIINISTGDYLITIITAVASDVLVVSQLFS